jgi:hypothetical protein
VRRRVGGRGGDLASIPVAGAACLAVAYRGHVLPHLGSLPLHTMPVGQISNK